MLSNFVFQFCFPSFKSMVDWMWLVFIFTVLYYINNSNPLKLKTNWNTTAGGSQGVLTNKVICIFSKSILVQHYIISFIFQKGFRGFLGLSMGMIPLNMYFFKSSLCVNIIKRAQLPSFSDLTISRINYTLLNDLRKKKIS